MSINLKIIKDDEGTLVPIELSDLPFEPRRIFYVSGVPKGEERGNHAHFETQQILVCLQVSILVKIGRTDLSKPYFHQVWSPQRVHIWRFSE